MDKIIRFDMYCGQCAYKDISGDMEPCNECLTTPAREDSKKPVKFKDPSEVIVENYISTDASECFKAGENYSKGYSAGLGGGNDIYKGV